MSKLEKKILIVAAGLLILVFLFGCGHGKDGANGSSCSVATAVGEAIISCTDGTTSLILNGTNGVDGIDGQDGQNGEDGQNGVDGQDAPPTQYTVTEIINPCGDNPGHDEVLFRMADQRIVAHYAGGGNLQFLTILSPGNYRTTDSSSCSFNVGPAPSYVVTF